MTKNPILNAFAASLYISFIASVMNYASKNIHPVESVFIPIAVVSLFTLSAAVMGYVFGYQPFQLYFDGKKKLAVNLFLQTIAAFAGITILIFVLLFSGIIK